MSEPVPDTDPPLPEMLGERYRTGRVLGRGGMARVYLAHDVKHGRDVAIKVIRQELSASLGQDRFLREIEIAARLRHPNIVPLYDSGEAGGSLYFVMPYEAGRSLRDRLAEDGPLPLPEALSVLRDVARALAYAHEQGVVHRDIKSDNVLLSGGAAVVTDFGIAKAVSAALTDASGPGLTQTGSAIGTPAYMSPEQATGDPATDHRTDIYAFGCLAYEVLTGGPPFHALPRHQVIAAQITAVPPPVSLLRGDVPPALAALIAQCLAKDPGARPQRARDLLLALDRTGAETGAAPEPVAGQARSPARALRWAVIAALAGALGVAGYLANRGAGSSAPISLVVMPFGNISADSALDFFADGLADELAGALTRVPGILIKSRSGARAYRGQLGIDVIEAGAKLKADYVVTAVIRRDRETWLVASELARAADAASLWSHTFTLGLDETPQAAETIAASLAAALRSQFPNAIGSAPALAANQRTSNREAHRLWVVGQEKLSRRGQRVRESAELFRAAIHEDTLFAKAYSGLSMALALFPYFEQTPTEAVRDEIEVAARRALALDSTLAQPHVALGLAFEHDLQWDRAGTEFETAIRLEPRDVEARVQFARYLLLQGHIADALGQTRAAREQDPASAPVLSWLSFAYFLNGQTDSALAESRRALDTDSSNLSALGLGALVRLAVGAPGEARTVVERGASNHWLRAYVLAKAGDTAAARAALRELDAELPQPWLAETRRAYAYLGLDDTARALTALERATDAGEFWGVLMPIGSRFYDPVRRSPRFQSVVRRIGIRQWVAAGAKR